MKEIILSKGKVALVDDEDFEEMKTIGGWYVDKFGYAITDKIVKGKRRVFRMHRLINKTPDKLVTDHINMNKLDNRKLNLRTCTTAENLRNRGFQMNNTSGFKGVHFDKNRKKWMAYIKVKSKRIHLGRFFNINDAITAYNNAAIKYHGVFARLNSKKGVL